MDGRPSYLCLEFLRWVINDLNDRLIGVDALFNLDYLCLKLCHGRSWLQIQDFVKVWGLWSLGSLDVFDVFDGVFIHSEETWAVMRVLVGAVINSRR